MSQSTGPCGKCKNVFKCVFIVSKSCVNMHFRAGRYIEFVQYIFIRDTVWRNTVNIEFVTSASEKIYILLFVKIAQNIEQIALKFVQMKFLAIHIAKQKCQKFWYIYGRKFTKYLHGTWSLLDILMIFGIKEWHLQCIVGYCYSYTCAAYDWFGAPGSHIITISMNCILCSQMSECSCALQCVHNS